MAYLVHAVQPIYELCFNIRNIWNYTWGEQLWKKLLFEVLAAEHTCTQQYLCYFPVVCFKVFQCMFYVLLCGLKHQENKIKDNVDYSAQSRGSTTDYYFH